MTSRNQEWITISLRQRLLDEFSGVWGSAPKGGSGNAVVLRSTNINDSGYVDYDTGADRNISPNKLEEKCLQPGDIMLEASGGGPDKPVGRVAYFEPPDSRTYTVSNFFRVLRPDSEKVIPRYLFWRLLHRYSQPGIWAYQQQTTGIINLKSVDYIDQEISWPPIPEQRRIADILDTVDAAIQQTDALIAKLKQVKAGLLHDLLTRGIGADGQLRDPVAHPEQFKDSSLGRIPREWEVVSVADVSTQVTDGDHQTPKRSDDGVLLLSARNVLNGKLDLQDVDFVPEYEYQRMIERCCPEHGDILISCSGTVGRVCMVPDALRFALVRSVALIKLNQAQCNSRYAEWTLRSQVVQR